MGPISWEEFKSAFFDQIFLIELMGAKVQDFIKQKQWTINIRNYALNFTKLSKYAPFMVVIRWLT